MKKHRSYKKMAAALICAIFVICCVLFVFSSHLHDCSGADCSVCEGIRRAVDILGIILSAFVLRSAYSMQIASLAVFKDAISKREHTPIGLKVKLSR
jgi:hypothetical protein